jgi:hypothetical protein
MAIDLKYGKITVEREPGNPLGDDEPVFVLRARDVVLPGLLGKYEEDCASYGCDESHLRAIRRAQAAVIDWQDAHSELVKTPDTPEPPHVRGEN